MALVYKVYEELGIFIFFDEKLTREGAFRCGTQGKLYYIATKITSKSNILSQNRPYLEKNAYLCSPFPLKKYIYGSYI